MPYYLDINPSNPSGNQYVTIPSITVTGDFTIEIDCEIYNTTISGADGFVFSGGTSGGGFEFYRDNSAQNYRPSLWYNNTKNFASASNVWPYASGSTANPRTITIQRVGGVVSSNFAGTVGTDVNIASGNNIVISAIGARPNGTFSVGMRLYRLRIYQGSTLVRDYNAANTSSGVALVDEVSGQNGTIQNPPAGNAQWVFYSSGSTSWEGTIGKTSLPIVNKSLSINTGQLLSPNKVTLTLSTKQQSISTGFVATNGKTSLTLSPKQESINVGYINTLSKLGLALLQKQLSITVGANLPFTGVIGKTTYALNGKQLGLALGWNGGVDKSTLPVSNKQESVLAGFVNTINEINIPVNGKPLNLQTGTSISYVGTINKGSLNVSGKPLNVVAGTSIPFVGLMQKTSLTLTGKQLGVVRGQVLDLQKQALNIVGKQLSLGEIVYPIVPIERVFTIKDGDRIHYFKQTTTVYVMKNN